MGGGGVGKGIGGGGRGGGIIFAVFPTFTCAIIHEQALAATALINCRELFAFLSMAAYSTNHGFY